MLLSQKVKNAVWLGTLCAISYLAVYIARNILSAATPQMVAEGYSEEFIGKISSVFFIFYAVGQLINGLIGDRIKAKWMLFIGLSSAGIAFFAFPYLIDHPNAITVLYGLTGFFLAMLYAPMAKVVSENMELKYATRCSLGYTVAEFLGSPVAGVFALLFVWQGMFRVSSVVLLGMAFLTLVFFSLFEKRKIVQYGRYRTEEKSTQGFRCLLERQIVKFSLVAILTGVVRTSVVFWLPTYIVQHLGFEAQAAVKAFTVATFIIPLSSFIGVFLYEKLGHHINKSLLLFFASSALFFVLAYFVSHPILNISLMVLAIMASNAAATIMFSCYCPSLSDTGLVSSATGFIDFLSYMGAAVANSAFANAAGTLGWGNLILVWFSLMVVGVFIALPYKRMLNCGKK